jgi:hypothetical protein
MRTFSRKNNAQERRFKYRKLEVVLSSVTARGLLTDARLTKQFTHITSSSWSVGQQTEPLDHKKKIQILEWPFCSSLNDPKSIVAHYLSL